MSIVRTVTKEIRWEAAHRLGKGYPGKCKWVHGHSWVAKLTIETTGKLTDLGFVQDFADFKPIREWVDKNWDHATLVYEGDGEFRRWLLDNEQKHATLGNNPTSEYLAQVLFKTAQELLKLNDGCRISEVRVMETCTSEACYRVVD